MSLGQQVFPLLHDCASCDKVTNEMNLRTLLSLIGNGQLPLLLSTMRLARSSYRVAFLAAGLSSGLLRRLAAGPVPTVARGRAELLSGQVLHQRVRRVGGGRPRAEKKRPKS